MGLGVAARNCPRLYAGVWQVAVRFSVELYQFLGSGYTVKGAFECAQAELALAGISPLQYCFVRQGL